MSEQSATSGHAVWRDLMTTDLDAGKAFYAKLFGWTIEPWDMGKGGTYDMFQTGEKTFGGVVALEQQLGAPSHWINYLHVDDVDAACARVKELGGKVCVDPFDIPKVGRTAVVEDPSGAAFSPFRPADGATHPPEASPRTSSSAGWS